MYIRSVGVIHLLILNGHLCLSGIWFGVDLIMDTQKGMCLKEIGLCAGNLVHNSRVNGQHNWRDLYDHSTMKEYSL